MGRMGRQGIKSLRLLRSLRWELGVNNQPAVRSKHQLWSLPNRPRIQQLLSCPWAMGAGHELVQFMNRHAGHEPDKKIGEKKKKKSRTGSQRASILPEVEIDD